MNNPLRGSIDLPGVAHGEIVLFTEPEDDISVLGVMVQDHMTALDKLKKLPFAGDAFRGDVRVVLGIAERTRRRCLRLLGEDHAESVPKPPASRRRASR